MREGGEMGSDYHDNINNIHTMLNEIVVPNLITVFYDKKDAVKVANHFRSVNHKCKIDSYTYCGIPCHTLTITKPDV